MLLWLGPARENERGVLVSVTPDSGATQTILHERLAVKAGVKIRRTETDISNANGGWLTVVGEADIRITYDKYIHETTALVSSDVNYNLLVAWHDLQFINVLSPNFPVCVSATMSESVKEEIVDEFPEVFRDSLTEEPMRVPEMRIELRDNAVPYCITTPRQVPLRYQESVSKTLDDLVASKIIAKETRPAEWCLPAFFVPKPGKSQIGYGLHQIEKVCEKTLSAFSICSLYSPIYSCRL